MTNKRNWIPVFPTPHFHEDRFRGDGNYNKILDSRLHGKDKRYRNDRRDRNDIDNEKDKIEFFSQSYFIIFSISKYILTNSDVF